MSQTSKIILIAIVAALIGGGGVYLWQNSEIKDSPPVSVQEKELNEPETISIVETSNEWDELVGYHCELSGGSFSNGTCTCPLEGEQTQEEMYDKSTGYCQTTYGGPGGVAFDVSVGLPNPNGAYYFWRDIVGNNCTETGGEFFMSKCTCGDGTIYNKSTGYCE